MWFETGSFGWSAVACVGWQFFGRRVFCSFYAKPVLSHIYIKSEVSKNTVVCYGLFTLDGDEGTHN